MLDTISEKTKMAFTVEEIAEQTTLSKAFLRLEIKRGKLKVKRFGRRVVVLYEDLRNYIDNGSDGSKPENTGN
jgi:excisionase family DNA binding protein